MRPNFAPASKRRNRKRINWHRPIRAFCSVALILEIGYLLFFNPYLRVTHVRVNGLETLSAQQVFDEAHVPARTNLFWMLLRQPFARRLRTDPVIAAVHPSFRLPDTLVFNVTEREPAVVLAANHSYWLLDPKGVPFRQLSKPQSGIPMVTLQGALPETDLILGRPLHASWLQNTYQLLSLLAQTPNLQAAKIKVDQNANLCLNNRDNLLIKLGQADLLSQKVAVAQEVLSKDQIARNAAYIDVSCPQQPVWRPKTPPAQD